MEQLKKWNITPCQWKYYRHWFLIIIAVEILMVCFNQFLPFIYAAIAFIFLVALLLRVFKRYPGEDEPLILDGLAVLLALGYALGAQWMGTSPWRFLFIFCSSGIIFPHFLFIARYK